MNITPNLIMLLVATITATVLHIYNVNGNKSMRSVISALMGFMLGCIIVMLIKLF